MPRARCPSSPRPPESTGEGGLTGHVWRQPRTAPDRGPASRPPVGGDHVSVKEAVLPFNRVPDADAVLGPEMRSTGEVMGIDLTFGLAFAKSQLAAGDRIAESGCVFMSLADRDKEVGARAAQTFADLGFSIVATSGTADRLRAAGRADQRCGRQDRCRRHHEVTSDRPDSLDRDAVDMIAAGDIQLVVNCPGAEAHAATAPTFDRRRGCTTFRC